MAKDTKDKYIGAVGRRKTSVARVRMWNAGKMEFEVNGKTANEYFKTEDERRLVVAPFEKGETGSKWRISVKVSGGGHHSQAEAVRHGISRALSHFDEALRPKLKSLGFLKRDPRAKERRKFGLKKARKAPKWSKR